MPYETQIEAGKKVIAAFKACRAAEAKIIAGLGRIQRTAQKGKPATDAQREALAQAHTESVQADSEAQRLIQSFANNYLE